MRPQSQVESHNFKVHPGGGGCVTCITVKREEPRASTLITPRPRTKDIYRQRGAAERINSQAMAAPTAP